MKMIFYSDANKTDFQKKGFTFCLVLKVRVFGNLKWPISFLVDYYLNVPHRGRVMSDLTGQCHALKVLKCLAPLSWVFLGVAETIVSSLLSCGVGIVECLFNILYYVIFGDCTRPQRQETTDHSTLLGNCPPTPLLSQHFALAEK